MSNILVELMLQAQDYDDMPAKVQGYLRKRGADPAFLLETHVGYITTSRFTSLLRNHKQSYGFKKDLVEENVEGIVLFPTWTPSGKLYGIQLRGFESRLFFNLKDENLSHLCGWHGLDTLSSWTKHCWPNPREIWICEGFFDVCALRQANTDPKILKIGTTRAFINPNQFKFLERFSTLIVSYLDNDKTGRDASNKLKYFCREQKSLRFYEKEYPFKDPGDIWDNYGEEGVRKILGKLI